MRDAALHGWTEAADLIVKGMEGLIAAKAIIYDFAHPMDCAAWVECLEFGDAIICHMQRRGILRPIVMRL